MLTVLACIFVFGILVTVHEFGHFITAKLTGMKVEEFSIGFGPKIYQQQDGETLYSLRMLPLGGYNKIAGMDPEDPEDLERGFNSKPVTSRMLVILAGSLMNFLLPVLIFFGLFLAVNFFKFNNITECILHTFCTKKVRRIIMSFKNFLFFFFYHRRQLH